VENTVPLIFVSSKNGLIIYHCAHKTSKKSRKKHYFAVLGGQNESAGCFGQHAYLSVFNSCSRDYLPNCFFAAATTASGVMPNFSKQTLPKLRD
jgi:hypothetical protein